MEISEDLRKAEMILRDGVSLCDSCLGRLFGMRGYGLTNEQRGRAIKTLLLMKAFSQTSKATDKELVTILAESGFEPAQTLARRLKLPFEERRCYLCNNICEKTGEIAKILAESLRGYEFETFQIGVRLPLPVISREERLWRLYGLTDAESLKNEISREVGKALQALMGRSYAVEKPEMLVILDFRELSLEHLQVELHPSPLYICGRYLKLARGLPQNPWPYPDGRIAYNTSIEELIVAPMVKFFEASGAKFHAAGREDIDARTLGSGRPFVVELKKPKMRLLNLEELEKIINENAGGLIEVHQLRYCSSESVKKYKSLAELAKKTYVARVRFAGPVNVEKLAELERTMSGVVVEQRTPLRVLHRRVNKLRRKLVYRVEAKQLSPVEVEFTIEAQGGLYIKEFIHGDEGRTKPSVADFLGVPVESIELDVVNIEEP
ncbi:MAG: tRNA pseudouridine(54/55) synthase Pus10 [Thermofilum sp.]